MCALNPPIPSFCLAKPGESQKFQPSPITSIKTKAASRFCSTQVGFVPLSGPPQVTRILTVLSTLSESFPHIFKTPQLAPMGQLQRLLPTVGSHPKLGLIQGPRPGPGEAPHPTARQAPYSRPCPSGAPSRQRSRPGSRG